MDSSGSKIAKVSLPPKISVQRFAESRAPEFESLLSVVSNRLSKNFQVQRNAWRRTTSFKSLSARRRGKKRRKRGLFGETSGLALASDKAPQKRVPRRVRRRMELSRNPKRGFVMSGDGTKRLRTHLWHAKRFTMTKLWGFHLPLGLAGRGRGSRAVLKLFHNGAVVHDSSYHSVVQLEGPEDSIISVLRMVLEPSPSAKSEDIPVSLYSGAIYGTAMLHHVGAPSSGAIGPVIYMWRPSHIITGETGASDHKVGGSNEADCSKSCSSHSLIWVWIHAAAFSEGFDALKVACQKQMTESGILMHCLSLEGQLGKLDIMGKKAFQILQRVLHPVCCNSEASWELNRCSGLDDGDDSKIKKASIPETEDSVSCCSVLSLTVKDPRTLKDACTPSEKSIADGPESASAGSLSDMVEDDVKDQVQLPVFKKRKLLPLSCSKPESNSDFNGGKTLWDANRGVSPPLEDKVLCMEKHCSRLDSIFLDDPTLELSKTLSDLQASRACPVLLLKNNNKPGSPMGWSVIMPLSWTRVFWNDFVLKGARAIGQREKGWIASNVGLPNFPSDFPDCSAYACLMASEDGVLDKKAKKVPSATPFKVPVSPPWNTIRVAAESMFPAVTASKSSTEVVPDPICHENYMVEDNSLPNSNGDCATRSDGDDGNKIDGNVARTSSALIDFLNEIGGARLLLFPQVANRKTGFPKFTKDESKPVQDQNDLLPIASDRKLCFVRVLLHAFKEGSFEEGAVVCAPHLSDISLWTSSDIEGGLQIPPTAVKSYFKEQLSGRWELEIPQDPAVIESHRWPIGFVTTGFVRGSKKPAAEAFCEAVLLARLREEQWNNTPVKRKRKEIFVLVRNVRSSAYRLARATVVLEQQVEDVEFL